ncbi:hypothetical protein B0H13DRAFT_46898 [Mycena leptocephala]|nr:hypothetical protein B0H13DRAFT_46898 [Mycena leptocephala]
MRSTVRAILSFIVLAVTVPPAVGQLTFACLPGGVSFDCSTFIPGFCDSIENISLPAGDNIDLCFGKSAGLRCNLIALNHQNTTLVTDVGQCAAVLSVSAVECTNGGAGQFAGALQYAIDPNSGACAFPPGN